MTFDGIGSGITNIPDDYGDRITTTQDTNTGFEYGMGNGFTPNVVVEYAPSTGTFSVWPSGYGDLGNALGHQSFSVSGEVILRPDPGYRVVLNSFDVAAWLADRNGVVRVLDEDGTVLFNSGLQIIPGTAGSGGHLTLPNTPLRSASALLIDIDLYGDHGLDNVNFDQELVPEPVSAMLMGLMSLGLLGRRGQRA